MQVFNDLIENPMIYGTLILAKVYAVVWPTNNDIRRLHESDSSQDPRSAASY